MNQHWLDICSIGKVFWDGNTEKERLAASGARLALLVDAGRDDPLGTPAVIYRNAHLASPAFRSLFLAI